jgi:hypothetical protein
MNEAKVARTWFASVPGAHSQPWQDIVKRGEWVHDKSKDANRIEALFGALTAQ